MRFTPARTAALTRLRDFVPLAGHNYARLRNFDRGMGEHRDVSTLSPYIRRRILCEKEVLSAVLAQHSLNACEKFVQEVFWRTYWKGWLEMRPSVWYKYQTDLRALENQIATQAGLRSGWEEACNGRTGVACFDAWAQELVETGYLHNHARMWFASIWIFTLKLPWQLGADFFLRHLLDGDPASNTLSWRWVAGLQTVGKSYLARADNIEKFTEGRFVPTGLAMTATPLEAGERPSLQSPPKNHYDQLADRPSLLLLHDENLNFDELLRTFTHIHGVCQIETLSRLSPWLVSLRVQTFVCRLIDDGASRWLVDQNIHTVGSDIEKILAYAQELGVEIIVTNYPSVGPTLDFMSQLEDRLEPLGVRLIKHVSKHDALCWPKATHGYFKFKTHIPKFLASLGLEFK